LGGRKTQRPGVARGAACDDDGGHHSRLRPLGRGGLQLFQEQGGADPRRADDVHVRTERIASAGASAPPLPPDALVPTIAAAIEHFSARDGINLKRIALLGWSEAQRNERLRAVMTPFYVAFRDDLTAAAERWRHARFIGAEAEPSDVAKTLLALIMGFVAQAAILGEIGPETIGRGLRALRAPEARTAREASKE
jgi:TetR/AcrR family transcriptional regulator, transcriptional repressor of aconitase